ncbi:MAG: hypothetical protein IKB16_01545 [Lentisphaeria bacterium]|nr:hypothetical protein [Lentisphaeria bacterium]
MGTELISLMSRLRKVQNMEDVKQVQEYGETLLRQKKNEAILTIMTVAEELGDSEILDSIDKMKDYLQTVLSTNK